LSQQIVSNLELIVDVKSQVPEPLSFVKILQRPFTEPFDSCLTQVISETKSFREYLTKYGKSSYASATLRQLPNKFICGYVSA
jgi:hypothetical protein